MKYIAMVLLVLLICCKPKNTHQDFFHPDGSLKYKVPVVNGVRNGEAREYYPSGELKGITGWENGGLNGKNVSYYKSGGVMQSHNHLNNVRVGKSEFYLENGILKEIQYFDSTGVLTDYKKFDKNGKQDLDIYSKRAIIISKQDTIRRGEYFEATIRIGNRENNSMEALLGDPADEYILYGDKLPKVDSITALCRIKADTLGENLVTGVVVDIDKVNRKEMVIVPFRYKFYVVD